jgi:hypothetical protein
MGVFYFGEKLFTSHYNDVWLTVKGRKARGAIKALEGLAFNVCIGILGVFPSPAANAAHSARD